MSYASVDDVVRVAQRFGALLDQVVFVGGSIVPLLMPKTIAPIIRPTMDVDCVVAATTLNRLLLMDRLKELGFVECLDPEAPTCRWVVDEIRVDVMLINDPGCSNRWYDQVMADALEITESGVCFRIASPATFLATKFEAFANRGDNRYMGDTDFEDIVTVMAYQNDLSSVVLNAAEPVRKYLIQRIKGLLKLDNLSELVGGCLQSDPVSQSEVPRLLASLRRIAAESGKEDS